MHISEFDYELPEELIAQQPLAQRDASRMLVVNRESQTLEDSAFESLPNYLRRGDLVVVNNTRVFPARLIGRRVPSGGRVEVLLTRELEPGRWEALARPAHRLKMGDKLQFAGANLGATDVSQSLRAEVTECFDKGVRVLRFENASEVEARLNRIGQTPLPAYIKRAAGTSSEDRERYQTVYARNKGAIAAPTAGLHFTENTMEMLRNSGIQVAEITLHVGYGTFEPVRVDEIEQHSVASEFFEISNDAAASISAARASGGRVIAIGTTTTRALESAINDGDQVQAGEGQTSLTITPGYRFRITDALLTNFHLPRSSLLLLVSAFAGRELTLAAYRHAVEQRYRFYSYGDCMFVI